MRLNRETNQMECKRPDCGHIEPKGKKAADNLFRLGLSLAGLKKNKEACAAFDKLDQDFPKNKSITEKQLKQQREKIKCG